MGEGQGEGRGDAIVKAECVERDVNPERIAEITEASVELLHLLFTQVGVGDVEAIARAFAKRAEVGDVGCSKSEAGVGNQLPGVAEAEKVTKMYNFFSSSCM